MNLSPWDNLGLYTMRGLRINNTIDQYFFRLKRSYLGFVSSYVVPDYYVITDYIKEPHVKREEARYKFRQAKGEVSEADLIKLFDLEIACRCEKCASSY